MVLILLHFRYRAVTSAYYRGCTGALVVYDITQKDTFENLERWLRELHDHVQDQPVVVMIIGNKADLADLRVVPMAEAKAFSERENAFFMETSALDGLNVETAFKKLITQAYLVMDKNKHSEDTDLAFIPKKQSTNIEGKDDHSDADPSSNTNRSHVPNLDREVTFSYVI